MIIETHGGNCCGMRHIFQFNTFTEAQKNELRELIRRIKENEDEDGDEDEFPRTGCIEVVLTDYQMMTGAGYPPGRERGGDNPLRFTYYGWAPHMAELGFKLVSRFQNSNHGNWCNVLHLHYGENRGNGSAEVLPYEWNTAAPVPRGANVRPAAAPAPAVAPVRVVHTSYHNVYRGGRRGAGYPSIIAAREQRAAGRIDKYEVLSDGSNRWTEDV